MSIQISEITRNLIVCSTAYLHPQQNKHKHSALLAFYEGNPPVTNGPPSHNGPVMQKVFPCDDIVMGTDGSNV